MAGLATPLPKGRRAARNWPRSPQSALFSPLREEQKALAMAGFSPPDRVGRARGRTGGNRGGSSGKVADFRYKRPSPSEPRTYGKPGGAHEGGAPEQRRQAYAALDLGTNNCRLLIARPAGDHFTVIDAFSRVVRLGEGLAASGRLLVFDAGPA